jgi:coenzyme F420-0:L-glutamate ligase/coenzyme F420-1:gamma-L-glutamate ligase
VDASLLARILAAVPRSPGVALELDANAPLGPAGATHLVRCRVTADGPGPLVAAGIDVHRLRCALAADGLASTWIPTGSTEDPGRVVGVLAVGPLATRWS